MPKEPTNPTDGAPISSGLLDELQVPISVFAPEAVVALDNPFVPFTAAGLDLSQVGPKWIDELNASRAVIQAASISVGRLYRNNTFQGTIWRFGAQLGITNSHVIAPFVTSNGALHPIYRKRLKAWFPREESGVVEAVHFYDPSQSIDLAVVSLSGALPPGLSLGAPGDGQKVFALGYPRAQAFSCSPGHVLEVYPRTLAHDCSTYRGSSGSPLLNTAGQVVAIHDAGVDFSHGADINIAVNATTLAQILQGL